MQLLAGAGVESRVAIRDQTIGQRGARLRTCRARLFAVIGWFAFGSSALAATVSFGVNDARLWLDERQVLPFECSPAGTTRVFDTRIEPANMVQILQSGTILDGEKVGFVRLQPLKPGKAVLHVGDAILNVEIKPDLAAEYSTQKEPRILSPSAGASISGCITVCVEVPAVEPGAGDPKVQLLAGTNIPLSPQGEAPPVMGANRAYTFALDADRLPPGRVKLQAVSQDAAGFRQLSEPIYVSALRPSSSEVIAENFAQNLEYVPPGRPRADKMESSLAKSTASPPKMKSLKRGGASIPTWQADSKIPTAGYYQIFLNLGDDSRRGSVYSIGLLVDGVPAPEATSRVESTSSCRTPLGRPVFLQAGVHTLGICFPDKAGGGHGAGSGPYPESYELLRVSNSIASRPGGAAMAMMERTQMSMSGDENANTPGATDTLRVVFARPFDGQIVDGPVHIAAQASWPSGMSAPSVDLVVNGVVVQTQYGNDLDFRLPTAALKPGKNVLLLRASSGNGAVAESSEQTVVLPAVPANRSASAPRMLRYGIFAPAWGANLKERLGSMDANGLATAATFYPGGEASLSLPDSLSGDFTVQMEARGQSAGVAPLVQCALHAGESARTVGQAAVPGADFHPITFGKIHLDAGPKHLVVGYTGAGAGSAIGPDGASLSLKAILLEEISSSPAAPPCVAIAYAPFKVSSAEGAADAVVVDCFAQDGIKWADLVIDGSPQHIQLTPEDGLGHLVFPLLGRSYAPGVHTMQVLAESQSGQGSLSPAKSFQVVSSPIPPVQNRYARAVYLLDRFGYGPEPNEVADILVGGEKPWLRDRLSRTWNDPAERAAMALVNFRYPDAASEDVIPKALLELLLTRNPVRARFTLWAENHFSTWIQKDGPGNKWSEHLRFLEAGVAPFRDLLFTSATSPAMLIYLDQFQSSANRINENYARELMELHTVGVHGGYTQGDVTSLAAILTGWSLSRDTPDGRRKDPVWEFQYKPMVNSPAARRVFGMEFFQAPPDLRYDRTHSAFEMLASHPSTARFISQKLVEHYVGDPAPPRLVDRLAGIFQESGGDMAELLLSIADSPEFWATMDKPRMATPFDYSLRLCRMTGNANIGAVATFLRKSGTELFGHPAPDGFPEADASYADSNAMLQRWNFVKAIGGNLRALIPASLAGRQIGWSLASQAQLIDLAATRLLGMPLSRTSFDAECNYLERTTSSDKVRLVTAFLAQLPEANLR